MLRYALWPGLDLLNTMQCLSKLVSCPLFYSVEQPLSALFRGEGRSASGIAFAAPSLAARSPSAAIGGANVRWEGGNGKEGRKRERAGRTDGRTDSFTQTGRFQGQKGRGRRDVRTAKREGFKILDGATCRVRNQTT